MTTEQDLIEQRELELKGFNKGIQSQKQKIIEEIKRLEDFYYSKFGRSIISDFCKELLKSINSQETKLEDSVLFAIDNDNTAYKKSNSSPDKTLGEKQQ